MTRWQLTTIVASISASGLPAYADPTRVWTQKVKDGKTAWDSIVDLADDGWELVSVTPIITTAQLGITSALLYIFKRPKSE